MTCGEAGELADAFVSEQLHADAARALVLHLTRCPECREGIDGLRQLRAAMREAVTNEPALAPRQEFTSGLRARLTAEAANTARASGQRSGVASRRSSIRTWLAGWSSWLRRSPR